MRGLGGSSPLDLEVQQLCFVFEAKDQVENLREANVGLNFLLSLIVLGHLPHPPSGMLGSCPLRITRSCRASHCPAL